MGNGIVLEDYLVRLGFDLNATGLNQFLELVSKGKNQIDSLFPSINTNLVKATVGVVGFLATAAVGTMKLIESVADADMQMEVFARRMWMNEEAARGMNAAAEALGYSLNDLSSIALSSELTEQFKELYSLTKELQAPAELQDQLKQVRAITFEWKKFGIVSKYAVYWVTYYLNKYLGDSLVNIKKMLAGINKWFEENLQKIAKNVAFVLANILHIISSIGKILYLAFDTIKDITGLTSGELIAAITLAGVAIGVMVSPLMGITAIIAGIVLLIDDFVTYLEGGESALSGLWEFLTSGIKLLIDGLQLVYYYARVIGAALKDAFNLDFSFPSVDEWNQKIEGIKSEYEIPGKVEGKSGGAWGPSNTNSFNQNVYVYSNDPKSAADQVGKNTELIVNRGFNKFN